jgi:NTP pyrophosphatase (non-canonical NTP hydrolase)
MKTLSWLQSEHADWLAHNFPEQKTHEPLLGLVEEVGELAHCHLKHDQGIRGYDDSTYREDAADAVGDIVIYLASYCNANGFDLELCVEDTWYRVQARDWKGDPTDGGESSGQRSTGSRV